MGKKEKIVVAANELLKNSNYQQMSTAKIAKFAGVAEGTLYRYFKNKDQIFLEAISYTFDEIFMSTYKGSSEEYSLLKNLDILANNVYGMLNRQDSIYKVYYKAFSEIENEAIKNLCASWLKKNFTKLENIFTWAIDKGEISIGKDNLAMVINWIWGTTELLLREAALGMEIKAFEELKGYIVKVKVIIDSLEG